MDEGLHGHGGHHLRAEPDPHRRRRAAPRLSPGQNGATADRAHRDPHRRHASRGRTTCCRAAGRSWTPSPSCVGRGATSACVFGGQQDNSLADFWSHGRMYTATSGKTGDNWTLPREAVGISHSAYGSCGTAATTLSRRHAGGGVPAQRRPHLAHRHGHQPRPHVPARRTAACSAPRWSATATKVWLAWYQNGDDLGQQRHLRHADLPDRRLADQGARVERRARARLPTGRVALAARDGGGVFAAYCVGCPTCSSVRVWKVGTNKTATVPGSKLATTHLAVARPSGRLWLAWADNVAEGARRTDRHERPGDRRGADAGTPQRHELAYSLAIDGTRGRGDIVLNAGNGIWHTQVLPGLTTSLPRPAGGAPQPPEGGRSPSPTPTTRSREPR